MTPFFALILHFDTELKQSSALPAGLTL